MDVTLHLNRKHAQVDEEKQFLCSICKKPSKAIVGLLTHIRVDHFQYLPYQCSQCELKFDSELRCKVHVKRRHPSFWTGGEKKYLCDECDSRFYTSGLLHSHKAKVHPSGIHPCSKCGNTFNNKHNLMSVSCTK